MVESDNKKYGFLLLENTRAENYKGWSLDEIEIYSREEYFENSFLKLKDKPNLISTHAVGAQKCHIKKLHEVSFVQDN